MNSLVSYPPGVAERPELLGAHAEGLGGAVDAALLDVLGARLHDLLVDAQQPRREVRLANLLQFAMGISRSHFRYHSYGKIFWQVFILNQVM